MLSYTQVKNHTLHHYSNGNKPQKCFKRQGEVGFYLLTVF